MGVITHKNGTAAAVLNDPTKKKAKKAQDTADQAKEQAETTAQHFWHENGTGPEAGAHVTEVPRKEWSDPNHANYHKGPNLLLQTMYVRLRMALVTLAELSAAGMKVYEDGDDENPVAQFLKERATIGKENADHINIIANEMQFCTDATTIPFRIAYAVSTYRKAELYCGNKQAVITLYSHSSGPAHVSLEAIRGEEKGSFSVSENHIAASVHNQQMMSLTYDDLADEYKADFLYDLIMAKNVHQLVTAQIDEYVEFTDTSFEVMTVEQAALAWNPVAGDVFQVDMFSGGGIKCLEPGYVLVSGQAQFYGVNDGNVCTVTIKKSDENDVSTDLATSASRSSGDRATVVVSPRLAYVNQNDTIFLTVANRSSGTGQAGSTSSAVTASDKLKNYITVQYV